MIKCIIKKFILIQANQPDQLEQKTKKKTWIHTNVNKIRESQFVSACAGPFFLLAQEDILLEMNNSS